ncbi:MAG: tetratricopeptide (TPR) repeat protein [Paraglaciecola sp.]|jgi:tetratricopeptide (TPR) repeat protein
MKFPLLAVILAIILLIPHSIDAKERKTHAMSLTVFKVIEEANLLVEEGDTTQAIEIIQLAIKKRTSKYEKAQLYTLLGSIYYRNSDEANAFSSFARVLESAGGMPLMLHQQTLKTLSQLSMVKEDYESARGYCVQLIEISEDKNQLDYALLTQANYKLEDWEQALIAAAAGLDVATQQQKAPDENLLLLLNAVHYEMKAMSKMVGVLELLIKHYPKKTYILYLASVYGQLDQLDKQTVVMESLYEDGRIKEGSQLRNLASLYMSEKVPYKSALLLEKAIKEGVLDANKQNYEMLSQAWQLAAHKDESIRALAEAAKLSDNGKNYLKKAYLHFDDSNWAESEKALYQAFDKGLKENFEGEAWLLLGMTRFNMKDFDEAIEACEKAKKFKKSTKFAVQWIRYISTEKDKYNMLKAAAM